VHSAISIDVAAPPDVVFGLAHRVDRWDALLPHYARSVVAGRLAGGRLLVTFVAIRPLVRRVGFGLPVAWRAQTWNEPGRHRLRFRHVAGVTRGMDVTWRIEPTARGCRVTIEHDFAPRLPGLAAFVDRWFTRPIAGRTLTAFKALAEAVAGTKVAPLQSAIESEPASATNQPT
jgi:ribosome-associated toxin RatA of RatAB toxin-antitoxin module